MSIRIFVLFVFFFLPHIAGAESWWINYWHKGKLLSATEEGDLEQAEYWLNRGVDIHVRDKEGNTPLHIAVREKHLELVKLFVERGANIYFQNDWGTSPYHLALFDPHLEIQNFFDANNYVPPHWIPNLVDESN